MRCLGLVLALFCIAGCQRKPSTTPPQRPVAPLANEKPNEYTPLLQKLLTEHGDKNVIVQGASVGVKGKSVSFAARTIETENATAEVEFLISLPDGQVIHEFVAGVAPDVTPNGEEAKKDAVANFVITTFHPIYSAFINPNDTHLVPQKMVVHGKVRLFYVGDEMVRSFSEKVPTFESVRPMIMEWIKANLPYDNQAHWVKIVYSRSKKKVLTVEVTLDNERNEILTSALSVATWPETETTYIYKNFILVK